MRPTLLIDKPTIFSFNLPNLYELFALFLKVFQSEDGGVRDYVSKIGMQGNDEGWQCKYNIVLQKVNQ